MVVDKKGCEKRKKKTKKKKVLLDGRVMTAGSYRGRI